MEIDKLLEMKRDHILRTADKHGARNVRVFGSVARGEAGLASDVDFLVKMDKDRSLLDLSALVVDLRDLRFSPFFRPWSSLKKNLPEMTNRQNQNEEDMKWTSHMEPRYKVAMVHKDKSKGSIT